MGPRTAGEHCMQDTAFDLPRYLAALPLFKDMPAEALARVAAGTRVCRFARNDTLFRVGAPCQEFFIVVFGQIKMFALSAAGQEKVLELVGPGMSFAEAPMFVGGMHRVSAQALVDSLLLAVGKPTVLDEIARDSGLALRMLAGLSRRLHRLNEDVEASALHTGLRRVADYLLNELQEAGVGARAVSLPASKATIALRLSLTPEYFSRMLHQLESEGLIRIDKRAITITNAECLRTYSSLGAGAPEPPCHNGVQCLRAQAKQRGKATAPCPAASRAATARSA